MVPGATNPRPRIASVGEGVDESPSDSVLEFGGVPLDTRGQASDSAQEDRVETEQHDRREGIEKLRSAIAQAGGQVYEAAPIECSVARPISTRPRW